MASSAALPTMLIENVSNQADQSRVIGVARRCMSSRMCFSTPGGERVLLDVVCFVRFSCIRIARMPIHTLIHHHRLTRSNGLTRDSTHSCRGAFPFKKVPDGFPHDFGDRYISYRKCHCSPARISGNTTCRL